MGICDAFKLRRFWVAIMVFWTTWISYMYRTHFPLSLEAMVKKNPKVIPSECLPNVNTNVTIPLKNYGPRYPWVNEFQLLLGAYFYGYIITSFPAGPLAEACGPAKVILISMIITLVLSSLSEFLARFHWGLLFLMRFLMGMMGGVHYPAIQCLIGKWAPPKEKGKWASCMMGNVLGSVVVLPMAGLTISFLGYAWSFHFSTIASIVYCIAFFFLVGDSPESYRWISDEEKEFIKTEQEGTVKKVKGLPPFCKMFTSIPFIALVFAQLGNMYGLSLIIQSIPAYLVRVQGFKIKESGFLNALPYLGRFIMGWFFGIVGDVLLNRGVKKIYIRKVATIISHVIPALMLYLYFLCGCNQILGVLLYTLMSSFNGAVCICILTNPQDLSPNYAGTIHGIMNVFGGATGFIAPAVAAAFTGKRSGTKEWAKVFAVGATVYLLCGIIFIIFCKADVQPWNNKEAPPEEGAAEAAAAGAPPPAPAK